MIYAPLCLQSEIVQLELSGSGMSCSRFTFVSKQNIEEQINNVDHMRRIIMYSFIYGFQEKKCTDTNQYTQLNSEDRSYINLTKSSD